MAELVVTVNAPGEVAGYLLPLAACLKARDPDLVIRAVITPCPFAGGRERQALASSRLVDEVIDFRPYLWRVLRRRRAARGAARTLVLHMGGDRLYPLGLSRLLGAPAWVYGTARRWCRRYQRCLVPDGRAATKLRGADVEAHRIAIVGELAVDSVPERPDSAPLAAALGLGPQHEVVLLMAGSRPYEVRFMVPFYAELIDWLAATRPAARCVLPISALVDQEALGQAFGRAGVTVGSDRGGVLRTRNGVVADTVDDPYAAMALAHLAVTLPGTNTLQLAALGVPTVMLAPLNEIETMVVEGPMNWLSEKWWPTRALKRALLLRLNRRLPFLALPNIIANEPIVPEMRETLTPEQVGREVVRWLDDPDGRRRMASRLRQTAGDKGAAQRLAAEVLRWSAGCASGS